MSESYTLKTQELFASFGIRCVPGRRIVKEGRNPDLFCINPHPFWIEVKYIEEPKQFARLGDLLTQLHESANETYATGSMHVYTSNVWDDSDVRLAKEALKRLSDRMAVADYTYMMFVVQKCSVKGKYVEFPVVNRKGRTLVVSTKSNSGTYGLPVGHRPDPWVSHLQLTEAGKGIASLSTFWLDTSEDAFSIALVMKQDQDPFRMLAVPSHDITSRSNRDEIRRRINDARSQFKNALKYKAAGCVLVIWQDCSFAGEPAEIASAVYGDWKVRFWPTRPELGSRQVYEGNAPFASDKNTTFSALCYIPEDGQPTTFHNFFAERKLPHGLIRGTEYMPQDNGLIVVREIK